MSGGHFEYSQGNILQLSYEIEEEIRNNKICPEWMDRKEFQSLGGMRYSEETMMEFRKAVELCRKTYIYVQRIDWLLSGDDSEDTFHERLKEDLGKEEDDD